jgi:hypothetical protein
MSAAYPEAVSEVDIVMSVGRFSQHRSEVAEQQPENLSARAQRP